jgi:hypothetical protein
MHVSTVCQWLKWCGTDPFYSTVKTILKIEMIKQKTSDQTDSLHLPPPPPPLGRRVEGIWVRTQQVRIRNFTESWVYGKCLAIKLGFPKQI